MKGLIRGIGATSLLAGGAIWAFAASSETPEATVTTANAGGLTEFGETSVPADMTGHQLADLFLGANGTERYYRYQADQEGNVPSSVAFCDVTTNPERPAIIDVASQGATGIYKLAALGDQMKPDTVTVNYENRTCGADGMTFGFGSR